MNHILGSFSAANFRFPPKQIGKRNWLFSAHYGNQISGGFNFQPRNSETKQRKRAIIQPEEESPPPTTDEQLLSPRRARRPPLQPISTFQSDQFLSFQTPTQVRTELSRARWIEEIKMAEVIEKKGSMWVTTGVIRNGKLYCHIEEIGYLAQIGALVLVDEEDNIMDLKDIYRKCSDRQYGCTWESFEAYRHLKSLGYIIGRHGQLWSLKHDKVNSSSDSDLNLITGGVEEMHISVAKLTFDIYRPNSKFKKTDPGIPSFIICLVGDKPPSRKEVENLEKNCKSVPLKFCHINHDNVSFFSFPKVSVSVLP